MPRKALGFQDPTRALQTEGRRQRPSEHPQWAFDRSPSSMIGLAFSGRRSDGGSVRLTSPRAPGNDPPPRLERVLLPHTHQFEVAVPEGVVVQGYVLSYEIWNVFVRVNIALVDTPLGSVHDRPALRLVDGTYARLVQGNGGGGERFSALSSSFVRPTPQTVALGLGGGRLGKPDKNVRFTPIMELEIP